MCNGLERGWPRPLRGSVGAAARGLDSARSKVRA